ncbi:hypothetical protein [Brucella anthropi]|uniref:hypothetical protein n=1 Tax=Brucella anthropi TaxID=529 RepID=UPI0005BA5F9D|nr:hypothetical protein [Brucella anthropi]KIU69139.1 hypothetical protein TR92_07655 [Brucella anthropi]
MSDYLMIHGDDATLKSYKSSTVGTKSVLRLELEVSDHLQLGYLLRACAAFQADQKAARTATKPKSKSKTDLKALPAPMLQLPYHGDEQ